MAQAEDTELRDLVIEALEKNGSLAKIRALLRANIFLAFEDECDNIKQNVSLDNILNIPEGILCLSVIHEFLEFCNLKNTLFVYKSETRQGKDYNYEGQKVVCDKLNLSKRDSKEPVLLTLMKTALKSSQRNYFEQNHAVKAPEKRYDHSSYKDDQNCTYIVHEDSSSATSNSQSDNSSDEKNKLHLRLQLDNSDTDTSSDSAREKTSSEYIPNEHIIMPSKDDDTKSSAQNHDRCVTHENLIAYKNQVNTTTTQYYLGEGKIGNNSSSDSTSYVDLKPFTSIDKKLLNTTGIPIMETVENNSNNTLHSQLSQSDINKEINSPKPDSALSATVSSLSSSLVNENSKSSKTSEKKGVDEIHKSDAETAEYSYDFSSSSPKKDSLEKPKQSPESIKEDISNHLKRESSVESHQQNSASSHSSVSISDVADLISEKSFSYGQPNNDMSDHVNNKSKSSNNKDIIKVSRNDDDSGDFSESPVPSLSNLSLDVHSD